MFAELIRAGLQALIEAEATEAIGAGRYQRTDGRGTHRNGHRPKTVSTTAGDIEVQIPKLRAGSFFPSLLERRRRIDRALHRQELGVHGFTYDPTVGEFFLSHENIRIPERGKTYSINEGNYATWTDEVKRWNAWIKEEDKETGRPYGCRYVGTLVADAHRTLLKGGIFAYPADKKSRGGKLRLLYEANPFAFIFEAAGGKASTGSERILDIVPEALHQRVPLVIGSRRRRRRVRAVHDGKR